MYAFEDTIRTRSTREDSAALDDDTYPRYEQSLASLEGIGRRWGDEKGEQADL